MCFIFKSAKERELHIATKDIEVFKICSMYGSTIHSYYYQSVTWKIGETKERLLAKPQLHGTDYFSSKGLYSYAKRTTIFRDLLGIIFIGKQGTDDFTSYPPNSVKLNCIIPKGSKYYKSNSIYVSDKLKVVSVERNFPD